MRHNWWSLYIIIYIICLICCIIFMSVCTLWQGRGNQQWQFTGTRIDRVCSHPKEILLKFGLTPEYLYLLSDKRITRLFMVTSRGSGSSEKIAEFRSVDRLDDHGATPATVLCRLSVDFWRPDSAHISMPLIQWYLQHSATTGVGLSHTRCFNFHPLQQSIYFNSCPLLVGWG